MTRHERLEKKCDSVESINALRNSCCFLMSNAWHSQQAQYAPWFPVLLCGVSEGQGPTKAKEKGPK